MAFQYVTEILITMDHENHVHLLFLLLSISFGNGTIAPGSKPQIQLPKY